MPNTAPMVLPQYQGNYYDLQNRQALAQALMGQAMQNQASQIPTNMPVMPKYSIGAGLTQLGQAYLAAKMQQSASQGLSSLGQQQMAYLSGGGAPAQATAQQQAPQTGTTPNPFAGDQGGAAAGATQTGTPAAAAPSGGGLLAPGSAMNPSGMDPSKAAYLYYTLGPEKYSEQFVAPYVKPTDATLMARAGGTDVVQANRDALLKANNLPYNSYAPNMILQDPHTGQMSATPSAAPDGSYTVLTPNGPQVVQTPGALSAMQSAAAAKAAGEGSAIPFTEGKDAAGNPLPVMSRTQAATGNLPLPLRNNNPGAVSPGGSVAQYPDMQTGIKAMDSNLASYAGKKDAGTLGQVITKWVGSPENAPAYIKDVTSRLGISANTPVDLTNPAQRLAISSAIMLHENGAAAVFRGSQGNAAAPQQQSASAAGSAIYAAPPMGAKPAADASQTAAPESMQKDYDAMLSKGPQAQQSLESLDQMIAIAKRKPAYASGILGATPGLNRVSTDAAEYDKARANLIALRGTGGGGGKDGGSTDAARANIGESVPDYGKPQDAMVSGLTNLRNQVAQDQLRRQVLTGAYNSGDSKTYTTLANGFDQNFKPSMMPTISPILQMSGAQQQAAVQAAVKANPSLRSNFEVLFNAGLLK